MNNRITITELGELRRFISKAKRPIVFVVENGNASFCGPVIDKTFGYRVGNQHPNLGAMIRDFRSYESSKGRTPLVFIFRNVTIQPWMPDASERGWIVHTTDTEAGAAILQARRLCSGHYLRSRATAFRQFGRQELGEPPDYADLVNFAPPYQPWAEVVVASKEHERFCSETDVYSPGLRFYFRLSSLIMQPTYVAFLGGHAVCSFVELDKVDHVVVEATEFEQSTRWTPETFTDAGNELFEKRISNNRLKSYKMNRASAVHSEP